MHKNLFYMLCVILSCMACQQHKTNINKLPFITIGQTYQLTSNILKENREIIISLPTDYHKTNAHYPVLVLTDGLQNIKHTIGSIELLTRTGSIPPIIVIGIKSIHRTKDFTPTHNTNNPASGNGPNFLSFIEKEVLPFVKGKFRTHPFTILEGHSLGGLFTMYALMEKPQLFDAHILLSPSFWWDNEVYIQKAAPFFKNNPNLKKSLYFSIGKDESSASWGMRKELSTFIDSLKKHQPKNLRFEHREFKDEGHMSSPLLGTYFGLKWIFSGLNFSKEQIATFTNTQFLQH